MISTHPRTKSSQTGACPVLQRREMKSSQGCGRLSSAWSPRSLSRTRLAWEASTRPSTACGVPGHVGCQTPEPPRGSLRLDFPIRRMRQAPSCAGHRDSLCVHAESERRRPSGGRARTGAREQGAGRWERGGPRWGAVPACCSQRSPSGNSG